MECSKLYIIYSHAYNSYGIEKARKKQLEEIKSGKKKKTFTVQNPNSPSKKRALKKTEDDNFRKF